MTSSLTKTAYVGFFWNDSLQEVTDWLVADNRDDLIAAARDYLVETNIPDSSFETFLLQRLADWNSNLGARQSFTSTLSHGKLVLLSAPIERHDMRPRFKSGKPPDARLRKG